jgi:hypothetical protein
MRTRSIAALLCAATLSACGDDAVQSITASPPGASIKFFNFGVGAPGVNFYADGTKMTATSSTSGQESVLGTAPGGVGNGGFYAGIAPGPYALTGRISDTTNKDFVISTTTATLADGKYYSFYLSGIYNTTAKTVESFYVEDPFTWPLADFTLVSVRFVNAISNANPMTLYARNTTTGQEIPIGGAVAYKSAGAFVTLPAGPYDLITRYVGSTTNVITRTGVGFSFGRVYTVGARGDITVTSTTSANRPQLDNTANR